MKFGLKKIRLAQKRNVSKNTFKTLILKAFYLFANHFELNLNSLLDDLRLLSALDCRCRF